MQIVFVVSPPIPNLGILLFDAENALVTLLSPPPFRVFKSHFSLSSYAASAILASVVCSWDFFPKPASIF